MGWLYVYSWSASFYPQPLLNWRRQSTAGLTVDYPALNVIGFVSYTISTTCFLYSPKIKGQYALRHPLAPEPTVRFNDLAFAAHATLMVIVTYSQFYAAIWKLDVPTDQRTSSVIRAIITGCIFAVVLASSKAAANDANNDPNAEAWTWIDVIYVFGYIKLIVTFCKYVPQAWLNYQRKSTQGWSIGQILFDFAGGVLSMSQLLIDASFQGDWSGVTGNPAKFGLSNISLFFDVIFILQHYVLYRRSPPEETEDAQRLLQQED